MFSNYHRKSTADLILNFDEVKVSSQKLSALEEMEAGKYHFFILKYWEIKICYLNLLDKN